MTLLGSVCIIVIATGWFIALVTAIKRSNK